ncbi:MAG: tetratricopeptide repeat protein [Chloroflexota bacterium]
MADHEDWPGNNRAVDLSSTEAVAKIRFHQAQMAYDYQQWDEAITHYRAVLTLLNDMPRTHESLHVPAESGLAAVYLAQGDVKQAMTEAELAVDYLLEKPIFGEWNHMWMAWQCVRVLQAANDARAETLLEKAYASLQARIELLEDEETRRFALENVPEHREIVRLYEEMSTSQPKHIHHTINSRYLLHETLGQGGMGIVHRATDRLTGDIVALKQIKIPTEQLQFMTRVDTETKQNLRLSLAREFQILAGLRHPHIITVLDYGFDEQRLPYFTMTYLPKAQTFLEAGLNLDTQGKIDLFQQMLQALAYLHRRGIIHRDIKPKNVLVAEDRVRVLDFGLSFEQKTGLTSAGGTLLYMAPEIVLSGQPASFASDLYAVGVMAYELFAERHPFDVASEQFAQQLRNDTPDLSLLELDEPLAKIVGQLLAKTPEARFNSNIEACLEALRLTLGKTAPSESVAIRESYLQAAKFVGREAEQQQLYDLLIQTKAGEGQGVLIGGESGVGKSRLINEVQTQALVEGFTVLRGQGIQEGGLPYQLWRDPIRYLCVTSNHLSSLAASVLLPLIPDLPELLHQEIEPAPDIDDLQAQQRLFAAITELFHQQSQPILLILEDMQWAAESLDTLQWLLRHMSGLPLLIVGTYRVEEAPSLPERVSQMSQIRLERLADHDVQSLCQHMLGERSITEELVGFLQLQSEGNTFFLIEVVRALAEQAGQLETIGQMTLPETVFPAGITTILQQRLARIPEALTPFLNHTALVGRQLNLELLRQIIDEDDPLDSVWLPILTEAGWLIATGATWQFTHDKLREGLLQQIDTTTKSRLHQKIAEGLETLYPENPSRAAELMRHWGGAGNSEKECIYAQKAGHYAQTQNIYHEALIYWNRAEKLVAAGEIDQRYKIYQAQEAIYSRQGQREAQRDKLGQLETIVGGFDALAQGHFALRQASYENAIGNYEQAVVLIQKAIALGETAKVSSLVMTGHYQWGEVSNNIGDYTTAQSHFQTSLELGQKTNQERHVAKCWTGLGVVAQEQAHYDLAQQHLDQALSIQQKIGERWGEERTLNKLGEVYRLKAAYKTAAHYCIQALKIAQDIGSRKEEGAILNNLGVITMYQGDYKQAQLYYEQALAIQQDIGDQREAGFTLNRLGELAKEQALYEQAQRYCTQALKIAQEIGDRKGQGSILNMLGVIAAELADYELAQQNYEQALTVMKEIGERRAEAVLLNNLGETVDVQGDYELAQTYYEKALTLMREIGERRAEALTLNVLGFSLLMQGDDKAAGKQLTRALAIQQEIGDQRGEGLTLNKLGHVFLVQNRLAWAEEHYQQALVIHQALNQMQYVAESRAGLAKVNLEKGSQKEAHTYITQVCAYLSENPTLNGVDNRIQVFRIIWEVLTTLQRSAEAAHVLSLAAQIIQDYLNHSHDSEKRALYLAQPHHQFLWQAWQTKQAAD